jgi:hypothetical protein
MPDGDAGSDADVTRRAPAPLCGLLPLPSAAAAAAASASAPLRAAAAQLLPPPPPGVGEQGSECEAGMGQLAAPVMRSMSVSASPPSVSASMRLLCCGVAGGQRGRRARTAFVQSTGAPLGAKPEQPAHANPLLKACICCGCCRTATNLYSAMRLSLDLLPGAQGRPSTCWPAMCSFSSCCRHA